MKKFRVFIMLFAFILGSFSFAQAKQKVLAVANFTTEAGQEDLSEIPSSAIMDIARDQNDYQVLPPVVVKMRLNLKELPACGDAECAKKYAEMCGADFVIFGAIKKEEKVYSVTAGILDVGTGKSQKISGSLEKGDANAPKFISRALFYVLTDKKYKDAVKKFGTSPTSLKPPKSLEKHGGFHYTYRKSNVPSHPAALFLVDEKGKVKYVRPLTEIRHRDFVTS